MPSYIVRNSSTSAAYGTERSGECCPSAVKFFGNLTDKLLNMAKSLKTQFEELRKNQGCHKTQGAILASVDVPVMNIGVKYEYIEYIKRHGPPIDGVFDNILLEAIRQELGITNTI
jgi:hypothetical protein